MQKRPRFVHCFTIAFVLFAIAPLRAEDGPKQPIPDLTKGEKLERINERWVGPLGIYCGAWRPRQRSNEAKWVRQLLVQTIDKGSPADGVLEVGDVILGADGTGAKKVPLFEGADWAMIPIAEAITKAEARNPAELKLLIWRPAKSAKSDGSAGGPKTPTLDDVDLKNSGGANDLLEELDRDAKEKAKAKEADKASGKTFTVSIKLEPLGRYSESAPFNCEKSKRVLRKGIEALARAEKGDSSGFGVLCLLASDDPTAPNNQEHQAKAKEWVHQLELGGSPWFSGPKLMALSEYYMKTKDESIRPKLVAQAEHHAKGVSWFGTSGHRWSEKRPDGSDNGRIAGYGPITCSGALGFLGLSLAREAGVTSESIENAHKAQRAFFGHYALKSGMGYGEHAYGIGGGTGDYNGKAAMSALAMGLEDGQDLKAKYFTRQATLSSYSIRQYAHGGSYFGQVWHPVAAAQGGAKSANLQFKEVRWHMDLKRRWDHTRIYDSSGNGYNDFSHGATALLFYAAPLKQLIITGRGKKESLQFSDAEFEEILFAKNFDPAQASVDELIATFPKIQGMLRGRIAEELGRRIKEQPESKETAALIDRLLALAADEKAALYSRVGACCALMQMKHRSKEPVLSMRNADIAKTMIGLLRNTDPYVRFAGVRVMQRLDSKSVRPHADAIMDAIVASGRPTFPLDEEDPLQWAHGEMGDLLVKTALKDGLDGVNRDKLIPAIRSLLKTPNGSARSASTLILAKLNKEETLAIADLLVDNIQVSPPANAMFAGAAALNSQSVLAKHLFEEALPLSAAHGPAAAIKNKIPQKYGKAALNMDSAMQFMKMLGEQILVQAVDAREIVEGAEKGEAPEKLHKLKSIDTIKATETTLKLPAAQTELVVDATNYARRGENETTYTWRKVYGAGKVGFTPNSSGQSKTTSVSFIDKKPGKYRFEVAMSDTLGLNVLRETIDVVLLDKNGKLPTNKVPKASTQTLAAVPGLPLAIALSGTDPEGDDLGFAVTQQPNHGRLSGVGGDLTYTANLGYNGNDQFTFDVIDGQGQTASGTVNLMVSDKNVGVVVYEGFDYPAGGVHGEEGGSSFGFAAPWQNSRRTTDNYKVVRDSDDLVETDNSSISYPTLPSTGGRITGGGHTTCSRRIDTKLLAEHRLLENAGELWFSVIVDGPDIKFELKGSKIALGFWINSHKKTIDALLNGERAGESRNPWSRSANLRFPEKEPHMIIGRCVWGKTDEDIDTFEIYRVFDAPRFGPLVLDEPVCVLKEIIPQQQLNAVNLNMGERRAVDEIRIGTTLHSVLMGTRPTQ